MEQLTISIKKPCYESKDMGLSIDPTPKTCACGCGAIIPTPKYPSYIRNYIHGHNPGAKGDNHWNWKGGVRVNGSGYIVIYKPHYHSADKKGYVLEHRLVMEKYLNRYLQKREHIHHKNSNKQDNRIENLQLTTISEHIQKHKPHLFRKVKTTSSTP
jgi:hypothetical protein